MSPTRDQRQEMTQFSDIDIRLPACNGLWNPVKDMVNRIATSSRSDDHFCDFCAKQLVETNLQVIHGGFLRLGTPSKLQNGWFINKKPIYIMQRCRDSLIKAASHFHSLERYLPCQAKLRICGTMLTNAWTLLISHSVLRRRSKKHDKI